MSLTPLVCEHLRIDPLTIVTHAQAELLGVVADLDLDPSGMRVPEGIAKRFRSNLVDLVTKNRMELSRLAFDGHMECRSGGRCRRREFCSERADRQSEVIRFDGGGPQSLDGIARLP